MLGYVFCVKVHTFKVVLNTKLYYVEKYQFLDVVVAFVFLGIFSFLQSFK